MHINPKRTSPETANITLSLKTTVCFSRVCRACELCNNSCEHLFRCAPETPSLNQPHLPTTSLAGNIIQSVWDFYHEHTLFADSQHSLLKRVLSILLSSPLFPLTRHKTHTPETLWKFRVTASTVSPYLT